MRPCNWVLDILKTDILAPIKFTAPAYGLLINGQIVPGERTLAVVDPATGKIFTEVACASAAQMEAAVSAASAAFPGWAATPLGERQACLVAIADRVDAHLEALARLVTLEQGTSQLKVAAVSTAKGYTWNSLQPTAHQVVVNILSGTKRYQFRATLDTTGAVKVAVTETTPSPNQPPAGGGGGDDGGESDD